MTIFLLLVLFDMICRSSAAATEKVKVTIHSKRTSAEAAAKKSGGGGL